MSGTPFTVTANGGTINTPGETNLVGRYRVLRGIEPNSPWFDTTAFGQPAGCPASPAPCPLAYGNVLGDTGRTQFTGPGYIQDNLSVYKKFRIREGVELEARADAFQFNNPSASITSSTFGKVTSTLGSGIGVNGIGGDARCSCPRRFASEFLRFESWYGFEPSEAVLPSTIRA